MSQTAIPHNGEEKHTLTTVILGFVGILMFVSAVEKQFGKLSIVFDTILLVIYLAGVMGITPIPFPTRWAGRLVSPGVVVKRGGILSAAMDSFLVLVMINRLDLKGSEEDKLKFKAYAMQAALLVGLGLYFGEVYFLPLGLQYGMVYWHSMLPLVPPLIMILVFLVHRTSKLDVRLVGDAAAQHAKPVTHRDYIEFAAAIVFLLVTHDSLLCLGALFFYASLSGQGNDLIKTLKLDIEMNVLLLLVASLIIQAPLRPCLKHLVGWPSFFPSAINAVVTGSIFPVSGDVWMDTFYLSEGCLLLPSSSLVGLILFKRWKEWKVYMKTAPLTMVAWAICYLSWFKFVWPLLDPYFYSIFPRPILVV